MFIPSALFISWLVGAFITTEAKLQSSGERFRQLATSAPVGIFQTDAQGILTYVNPAWFEISGIQEGWSRVPDLTPVSCLVVKNGSKTSALAACGIPTPPSRLRTLFRQLGRRVAQSSTVRINDIFT